MRETKISRSKGNDDDDDDGVKCGGKVQDSTSARHRACVVMSLRGTPEPLGIYLLLGQQPQRSRRRFAVFLVRGPRLSLACVGISEIWTCRWVGLRLSLCCAVLRK